MENRDNFSNFNITILIYLPIQNMFIKANKNILDF